MILFHLLHCRILNRCKGTSIRLSKRGNVSSNTFKHNNRLSQVFYSILADLQASRPAWWLRLAMNIDAEPVLPVSGFSIQWCSWLGKHIGFVCESDDTMVSNQQGTRWIQLDPSCSLLLATFVLFSSSANKAFLHPIDIFGRNSEIHLTFQLWYWSPIHNS